MGVPAQLPDTAGAPVAPNPLGETPGEELGGERVQSESAAAAPEHTATDADPLPQEESSLPAPMPVSDPAPVQEAAEPKLPEGLSRSLPPPIPPAAERPAGATPPPPPPLAAASMPPPAVPPPAAPASPPAPTAEKDLPSRAAAGAPEHHLAFKVGLIIAGAASLFMVVGGGWYFWQYLKEAPAEPSVAVQTAPAPLPSPPAPPAAPPPAPQPAPTAAEAPAVPPRGPGSLVAATAEQVSEQREMIHQIEPVAASPVVAVEAPSPTVRSDPPPQPVTVTRPAVPLDPRVQAYVDGLHIGGVYHGTPSRILINNRTFEAGRQVEDQIGIIFEHVDVDAKVIIFRDGSGAEYRKRY